MKNTKNEVISYTDKTRYTDNKKEQIKNKNNYQPTISEIRINFQTTRIMELPKPINQAPGLI